MDTRINIAPQLIEQSNLVLDYLEGKVCLLDVTNLIGATEDAIDRLRSRLTRYIVLRKE